MNDNRATIAKLQRAINTKGGRVLVNNRQYFSLEAQRARNHYSVIQEIWNEDRGKYMPVEIYHGSSLIQVVLFLRDFWYKMNDMELPTDNQMWNELREKCLKEQVGGQYNIYAEGYKPQNNNSGHATIED